jgi:hypothetical protein
VPAQRFEANPAGEIGLKGDKEYVIDPVPVAVTWAVPLQRPLQNGLVVNVLEIVH